MAEVSPPSPMYASTITADTTTENVKFQPRSSSISSPIAYIDTPEENTLQVDEEKHVIDEREIDRRHGLAFSVRSPLLPQIRQGFHRRNRGDVPRKSSAVAERSLLECRARSWKR